MPGLVILGVALGIAGAAVGAMAGGGLGYLAAMVFITVVVLAFG